MLSRRGAVIPQVHREQHQPLKSSPSIQMSRLFMYVYLAYWIVSPIHYRWDITSWSKLLSIISHRAERFKSQRCVPRLSTERSGHKRPNSDLEARHILLSLVDDTDLFARQVKNGSL